MNAEMRILAENQASICSIFANPKRVMILWSLTEQEKSVTELALVIGASLQSTSQHLRLMKSRHILETRREGQSIYYRIADNELLQNCGLMWLESKGTARENSKHSKVFREQAKVEEIYRND